MPGFAMPAAVVTITSSAAIAPPGQSAGNLAPDASAIAFAGEISGDGAFAALLGRQIASATTPVETASGAVIAAADPPQDAPTEPAAQPVDLSVLLQGMLPPTSTRPDGEQTGDMTPDLADARARRPLQVAPGANVATGFPIQPMPDLAVESATFGEGSPGFAYPVAGDVKRAAADAAISGNPAESATRELPLQAAQFELQPGAPQASHRLPEPVRIERESVVVATPFTSPTWHEDLGTKVSMLIGKEAASAELVLTPPHLGRVEVQLSVSGDQTSATFVAATPAAREALEQALPKLREFLADAGINLTQASVGGDTQAGQGNADANRGNGSGQSGNPQDVTEIAFAPASTRRIDGMVDTFA